MNGVRARAFVYALLAAFLAQGIAATSHFHAGVGTAGGVEIDHTTKAVAQASKDAGSKHKGDTAAKCPLCQAASLSGSVIAASHSVFLPLLESFFVSHDERIVAVERFAAAWRSRAPPAH
jgi:hypothetical protein